MRNKLLLSEFINANSFGDVQRLVEESLKLLKENRALFEDVHDLATDETYKKHALQTIGKLKLAADRTDANRTNNMKSLILALKGIRDYFAARGSQNSDFVRLLATNIERADQDLVSAGAQVFEPVFSLSTNPTEASRLKSQYMAGASSTQGLFPRAVVNSMEPAGV